MNPLQTKESLKLPVFIGSGKKKKKPFYLNRKAQYKFNYYTSYCRRVLG